MSYCNQCGAQVADGDIFCGECGAPTGVVSDVAKRESDNPDVNRVQHMQQFIQGGYNRQPMQQGYPQQPTQQGYPQQPIQQGYPQQPMQQGCPQQPMQQGYPQQPTQQGYPQQPMQQGYPQQPMQQGYPQQPTQQGYPQQPMQQGYPQQPMQQGFPQQPMQQGFPQQPMQQGYPQRPMQQGFPQQPMQQGYPQRPMQQAYPQQSEKLEKTVFVPPTYPKGTPLITIIWEGTKGSIDFMQNWVDKKFASKTSLGRKSSSLSVKVNGSLIAPEGVLNYYEPFEISVPYSDSKVSIEINTKNWFSKDTYYEFIVEPGKSYKVVFTEPSILANSYVFGLEIFDTSGTLLAVLGNAPIGSQWLSLLIPFVGLWYSFGSQQSQENKSIKKLYLLCAITSIVIWALALWTIFK